MIEHLFTVVGIVLFMVAMLGLAAVYREFRKIRTRDDFEASTVDAYTGEVDGSNLRITLHMWNGREVIFRCSPSVAYRLSDDLLRGVATIRGRHTDDGIEVKQ